tara:strand:+ start:40 stop:531 length:492 start_codon:yes stop_codon:yes gene_type:complete
MAQFLSNSTTNSVVYSSGTWTTKVLPATQEVASSTTLVSVPEFKIALGKYERMLLKYRIHWSQGGGKAQFKVLTPTPVTDGLHTAFTGVNPNNTTAILARTTATSPSLDIDITGSAGYLEVEMNIENNATAGDIDFMFAQSAGDSHADKTSVLRGSYVEYMRF